MIHGRKNIKLIFQGGIPHAGKLGSHRCEKAEKHNIVRGSPIRGPPRLHYTARGHICPPEDGHVNARNMSRIIV